MMQLDWIEDILAVIDAGSLAGAAERRFMTQPAFTRRVRMIEERIGVTLFDRSRRPVVVRSGVRQMEMELREMAARLRRLQQDLRLFAQDGGRGVVLSCQHALATTISPWVLKQIDTLGDASVRVRSGNQDECLMLLVSGQADFVVTYECEGLAEPMKTGAFDVHIVGEDRLVPVYAPAVLPDLTFEALPVIRYPPEVFLRRVFDHKIVPHLSAQTNLIAKAETALTLAACEYALQGLGVAWLPLSLVRKHIAMGQLRQIGDMPSQEMHICLSRMPGTMEDSAAAIWRMLTEQPPLDLGSQRLPDAAPDRIELIG